MSCFFSFYQDYLITLCRGANWGVDDEMCAAQLRYILKNKRGPAFQNNLVDNIKDHLARLQEASLIDKLDGYMEESVKTKKSKNGQPKPKRAKHQKNENMQLYKKRRLEDQGPNAEVTWQS